MHALLRPAWVSSLTSDAIRRGFENLKPGTEYDSLANAARGRSRADWLVGMNLSRAYSLTFDEELSVGRVQTPTLAMLVEREIAIRNFVVEELSRSSRDVLFHGLNGKVSRRLVPLKARGNASAD
jgi:DNA topoisomerase-3